MRAEKAEHGCGQRGSVSDRQGARQARNNCQQAKTCTCRLSTPSAAWHLCLLVLPGMGGNPELGKVHLFAVPILTPPTSR